jgi:hypothetical protein
MEDVPKSDKAQESVLDPPTIPSCSFCGKLQDQVKVMIAGPRAHICEECVDICLTILADHAEANRPASMEPTRPGSEFLAGELPSMCLLCWMPKALAELIVVDNRGSFCQACIAAIQAAAASQTHKR